MSFDVLIDLLNRSDKQRVNLAKEDLTLISEAIAKVVDCEVYFIAYTPSWNDGEECTQCVDFNIPDEFYSEELWDKLYTLQDYVVKAANIVFEDNYEITFSKDGYKVEDYDCGY